MPIQTVFEMMSAPCSSLHELLSVRGSMPALSSLLAAAALAISFRFVPAILSLVLAVFRGLLESSLWLVLFPAVGEPVPFGSLASLCT